MATSEEQPSHLERTAAEPREQSLHTVAIKKIDQVNDQIRVFRLEVPREGPVVRFLPGQWLDVYVPGVPKAGGFTITSTPSRARGRRTSALSTESAAVTAAEEEEVGVGGGEPGGYAYAYAYLELAVQKSPENPPAAWLWQEEGTILDKELRVRVGGSFVWPPPGINVRSSLRKAVFVAGGVGVNPLMSMLSALAEKPDALSPSCEIEFLYSVRDPADPNDRLTDRILFLDRIASIFAASSGLPQIQRIRRRLQGRLRLFLTGADEEEGTVPFGSSGLDEQGVESKGGVPFRGRRITIDDVVDAVGRDPADRRFAVVYICGVPAMTDEFVLKLTDPRGEVVMEPHRVLCEKWW